MASGMVAEKNSVWRSFGNDETIFLMSWMKPMSSIRSASSRTRNSTSRRRTALPRTRSSRRPGVATSTSTPFIIGTHLLAHRHAADGERCADVDVAAVSAEALENLTGEFARRAEYQDTAGLLFRTGSGSRRSCAGSVAQRPPFCRCRSARCRRHRGPAMPTELSAPESVSEWCSFSETSARRIGSASPNSVNVVTIKLSIRQSGPRKAQVGAKGVKDTPRGLGCRLIGECGYRAENHNKHVVGEFVHAARSFDSRGIGRIRSVHMGRKWRRFQGKRVVNRFAPPIRRYFGTPLSGAPENRRFRRQSADNRQSIATCGRTFVAEQFHAAPDRAVGEVCRSSCS